MNKIIPYTRETVPDHWLDQQRMIKGVVYDKWTEYDKIISSFKTFRISPVNQQKVLEALHDEKTWDWFIQCNGANIVSEPGWKGPFSPPYVRHDYRWEKGEITLESNHEMEELQDDYGMDDWRSKARYIGVTWFGLPFYKTVNWFKSFFTSPKKSKYRNTIFKK